MHALSIFAMCMKSYIPLFFINTEESFKNFFMFKKYIELEENYIKK